MPVNKDTSGRRWVSAQVEVPGTPEQVWQAIATGPGISSWFVPTEVDEREGGITTSNFGPGMESLATITKWQPPHRFVADSRDDMAAGGPSVATEWIVEAQAGGTCIVRVVHAWFADSDDWDNQFEGHTYGWIGFFRILRSYLANFTGQTSAAFQVMGFAPPPKEQAWTGLIGALGLAAPQPGARSVAGPDAPVLAGVVEHVGAEGFAEEVLIRTDAPAPGLAHLFAMQMGGQVILSVRVFLYGDGASEAVAAAEPRWRAWMSAHFPMGG